MRLAIVQTNPEFGRVDSNLRTAIELMESTQADLYVLPELFNTGYNFKENREVETLAEPVEGPTFQALAAFAQHHSCHVAYGFAEKAGDFYNSASLVGPSGIVGLYRKVHLYDRETLFFKPGNLGFPVFDLHFGKVGIMICFDWIYPESARTLAIKGAQLIVHPSNLVLPYCPEAMITRCLENRVFTATADRVGRENRGSIDLRFIGTSEVVSPRGEIPVRMNNSEPGIAAVHVDLHDAEQKKINHHNDLLLDRKPEQYER